MKTTDKGYQVTVEVKITPKLDKWTGYDWDRQISTTVEVEIPPFLLHRVQKQIGQLTAAAFHGLTADIVASAPMVNEETDGEE